MTDRPQYPQYPGEGDDGRQPPVDGQTPSAPQPRPAGPGQTPPPGWGQTPPPSYGQPPPQGWGQAPQGHAPSPYGYGYPPPPVQDQKAVWGLVLGIVSILFCYLGVLIGPVAIVLSVMAARDIDAQPPGAVSGKGMATAGLVTGIIGTLIWGAVIALVVIGVAVQA